MALFARRSPFAGRTAVVTGAGSGIGAALARGLARRGALVVATDVRLDAARKTAEACAAIGPRALARTLDVTDPAATERLVDEVEASVGQIDVWVCNAGIGLAGDVRDVPLSDWERVVDVDLWGVVHGVRAVYPRMCERGGGFILNVASGAGLAPRPGMVPYATAKHAVVGLSTSLRAEGAAHGVAVTALCPGFVDTGIQDATTYRGLDADALRASIPVQPISAEACAEIGLRALAARRAVVTAGASATAEWWLQRLAPRASDAIAAFRARTFRTHRRV